MTSATGQAESVGESWSCAQVIDARYPAPRQQHRIRAASGSTYVTDVDEEWLVVGEYDGLIKCGRLCMPGESIADAGIREKLREDEIRDTGPRFVRWTWNDLERDAFIPRLHRRLAPLGVVAA
ncbi:hypothetical protein [Gordonia oryzae]|uniref:hypothetical protein n=1 Tax=Gordonia oryzae TaxID=2487349 RepID=UPI001FE99AB6|nr:hypothetical protein [Gordonia oryzae]